LQGSQGLQEVGNKEKQKLARKRATFKKREVTHSSLRSNSRFSPLKQRSRFISEMTISEHIVEEASEGSRIPTQSEIDEEISLGSPDPK